MEGLTDPGGGAVPENFEITVGLSSCCLDGDCYASGGTGFFQDTTQKASIDCRENLTMTVFLLRQPVYHRIPNCQFEIGEASKILR